MPVIIKDNKVKIVGGTTNMGGVGGFPYAGVAVCVPHGIQYPVCCRVQYSLHVNTTISTVGGPYPTYGPFSGDYVTSQTLNPGCFTATGAEPDFLHPECTDTSWTITNLVAPSAGAGAGAIGHDNPLATEYAPGIAVSFNLSEAILYGVGATYTGCSFCPIYRSDGSWTYEYRYCNGSYGLPEYGVWAPLAISGECHYVDGTETAVNGCGGECEQITATFTGGGVFDGSRTAYGLKWGDSVTFTIPDNCGALGGGFIYSVYGTVTVTPLCDACQCIGGISGDGDCLPAVVPPPPTHPSSDTSSSSSYSSINESRRSHSSHSSNSSSSHTGHHVHGGSGSLTSVSSLSSESSPSSTTLSSDSTSGSGSESGSGSGECTWCDPATLSLLSPCITISGFSDLPDYNDFPAFQPTRLNGQWTLTWDASRNWWATRPYSTGESSAYRVELLCGYGGGHSYRVVVENIISNQILVSWDVLVGGACESPDGAFEIVAAPSGSTGSATVSVYVGCSEVGSLSSVTTSESEDCVAHCLQMGSSGSYTAPCDGVFRFFANDCWECYSDNNGSFAVSINGATAVDLPANLRSGAWTTLTAGETITWAASGAIVTGYSSESEIYSGGPDGEDTPTGRDRLQAPCADYGSLAAWFVPANIRSSSSATSHSSGSSNSSSSLSTPSSASSPSSLSSLSSASSPSSPSSASSPSSVSSASSNSSSSSSGTVLPSSNGDGCCNRYTLIVRGSTGGNNGVYSLIYNSTTNQWTDGTWSLYQSDWDVAGSWQIDGPDALYYDGSSDCPPVSASWFNQTETDDNTAGELICGSASCCSSILGNYTDTGSTGAAVSFDGTNYTVTHYTGTTPSTYPATVSGNTIVSQFDTGHDITGTWDGCHAIYWDNGAIWSAQTCVESLHLSRPVNVATSTPRRPRCVPCSRANRNRSKK